MAERKVKAADLALGNTIRFFFREGEPDREGVIGEIGPSPFEEGILTVRVDMPSGSYIAREYKPEDEVTVVY